MTEVKLFTKNPPPIGVEVLFTDGTHLGLGKRNADGSVEWDGPMTRVELLGWLPADDVDIEEQRDDDHFPDITKMVRKPHGNATLSEYGVIPVCDQQGDANTRGQL